MDTRALTKKIREHGVMLGVIDANPVRASASGRTKFLDPNEENLVARVSTKRPETYGAGPATIVLIDCGMKENILRSLQRPGIKIIRVPWDYDFSNDAYDAIVISNGPGDPNMCPETIANVKKGNDFE